MFGILADFDSLKKNSSGILIPDVAAYELQLDGTKLTIYEYYDSKIVNIKSMSSILRNKYYYEYYFSKK